MRFGEGKIVLEWTIHPGEQEGGRAHDGAGDIFPRELDERRGDKRGRGSKIAREDD